MAAGDARTRLNSFVHQNGGSEAQVPEGRKGDLRTLQERQKDAVHALNAARAEEQRLKDELAELQQSLAGFDYLCTEAEVLEHQQALAAAELKAAGLRAGIAHQEQIIREAEGNVPSMDGLSQRREDLLADIATGDATAEALKTLDAQIEKRTKEVDQAAAKVKKATGQARQTIAGLTRKLAEAEAEVTKIKAEVLPAALVGYLKARAETAAEEYMQAASALFEKLQQLVGIGTLLKKFPEGNDVFLSVNWSQFRIPGFALKGCEGSISDRAISCFGSGGANLEEAGRVEAEKIRALGIIL
jgi:DNA repair exonuclease SbcCD ATPase subunit